MRAILFWLPRGLSIVFVGFISLFALDVFQEFHGWEVVLPLFMHLIPSFVLLALVAVAWKYELVGFVLFVGFGLLYIDLAGLHQPLARYLFISGPSLLIGGLFLLSWKQRK